MGIIFPTSMNKLRMIDDLASYRPKFEHSVRAEVYRNLRELPVHVGDTHDVRRITVELDNPFRRDVCRTSYPEKGVVDIEVYTSGRHNTAAAQEEFLHAAQNLVSQYATCPELRTKETGWVSNQLVHGSCILDEVLTRAAADSGALDIWRGRSKEQMLSDRERWGNQSGRTLLGTPLNRRFMMPPQPDEFIGERVLALAQGMEEVWGGVGGRVNDSLWDMLEIASWSYGSWQHELTMRLADQPGDARETDFFGVGRAAVEWGKWVLSRFENSPHMGEILGHHSYSERKPEQKHFSFRQLPSTLDSIDLRRQCAPSSIFTFRNLMLIQRRKQSEEVEKLVNVWRENGWKINRHVVSASAELGFGRPELEQIMGRARLSWERQINRVENEWWRIAANKLTFPSFELGKWHWK